MGAVGILYVLASERLYFVMATFCEVKLVLTWNPYPYASSVFSERHTHTFTSLLKQGAVSCAMQGIRFPLQFYPSELNGFGQMMYQSWNLSSAWRLEKSILPVLTLSTSSDGWGCLAKSWPMDGGAWPWSTLFPTSLPIDLATQNFLVSMKEPRSAPHFHYHLVAPLV